MPLPKKALPFGFEENPENPKQVKCVSCEESNASSSVKWILRASVENHQKSAGHIRAVDQYSRRRQRDDKIERQNTEFEAEYAALSLAEVSDSRIRTNLQNGAMDPLCSPTRIQTAAEMDLWANLDQNGGDFHFGVDPQVEEDHMRARLEKLTEKWGLWKGLNDRAAGLEDDDEDCEEDIVENDFDDAVADAPRQLPDISDEEENEAIAHEMGETYNPQNGACWPYSNKTMFLLDVLDNLPRQRISKALLRFILFIMQLSGCRGVPSFDSFRDEQKRVRDLVGKVKTLKWTSVQGNIFYMNDLRTMIARDYANPSVRHLMQFYPEIPDTAIREAWHADKLLRDINPDLLTPMYVDIHSGQSRHFYVKEISRLKNGDFVIPVRWVIKKGVLHADAYAVEKSDSGLLHVLDDRTTLISSVDLADNFEDLQEQGVQLNWDEISVNTGYPAAMPNPLRKLAGGVPLYTSFINLFCDDVSGNRSKSYNKHFNCYATHQNLPRSLLMQEFHVHFVSTSPHASTPEQFEGIKSMINSTHEDPMTVYDVATRDIAKIRLASNTKPTDNPMASEIVGHIGAKGNKLCRKCEVGGCTEHKQSDEGYHALFYPGESRTTEKTVEVLWTQIKLACKGVEQPIKDSWTQTGVKDAYVNNRIEMLIKRFQDMKKEDPGRTRDSIAAELLQWVEDHQDELISPLYSIKGLSKYSLNLQILRRTAGFDPAKDTPIEILHTILLGVVKYIWHASHTTWKDAQKHLYSVRLESTNISGLTLPPIRSNYIMKYANSLIGRQLKQVSQASIFHIHDIVDPLQYRIWLALGDLLPLLWYPEIRDIEQYITDVQNAVANLIDLMSEKDPSKMLAKNKLHILTHVEQDIRRHGVLVGVATEIFEAFNAVFRYCSIFSNHLAASRDIGTQLASQEHVKYLLTGGYFETDEGDWSQSGSEIQDLLQQHPVLQNMLGWTNPKSAVQGEFKVKTKKVKKSYVVDKVTLRETDGQMALNIASFDLDYEWSRCRYIIAESGDECSVGDWVVAESRLHSQPFPARINEILSNGSSAFVLLDEYQLLANRHEMFNMPVLTRQASNKRVLLVSGMRIKFILNVQHDCFVAKCTDSGRRKKKQEREETDVEEPMIEHKAVDRFVINNAAFHNAHLRHQFLPRELWEPVPLRSEDERQVFHCELAQRLRESAGAKKAEKKKVVGEKATEAAKTSKKRKKGGNRKGSSDKPKAKRRRGTNQHLEQTETDEDDGDWNEDPSEEVESEEENHEVRVPRPLPRAAYRGAEGYKGTALKQSRDDGSKESAI